MGDGMKVQLFECREDLEVVGELATRTTSGESLKVVTPRTMGGGGDVQGVNAGAWAGQPLFV
jgi:hypothetical protein